MSKGKGKTRFPWVFLLILVLIGFTIPAMPLILAFIVEVTPAAIAQYYYWKWTGGARKEVGGSGKDGITGPGSEQ